MLSAWYTRATPPAFAPPRLYSQLLLRVVADAPPPSVARTLGAAPVPSEHRPSRQPRPPSPIAVAQSSPDPTLCQTQEPHQPRSPKEGTPSPVIRQPADSSGTSASSALLFPPAAPRSARPPKTAAHLPPYPARLHN